MRSLAMLTVAMTGLRLQQTTISTNNGWDGHTGWDGWTGWDGLAGMGGSAKRNQPAIDTDGSQAHAAVLRIVNPSRLRTMAA